MSKEQIYDKLVEICRSKNISDDTQILQSYSKDLSLLSEKSPKYVVWPKNSIQVKKILDLANSLRFFVIPISSKPGYRHHGDTIPRTENCVILDLSKLTKILNIDKNNRVVMVEPGVTFGKLIPHLHKKGLKLMVPLHPRASKSVLTAALERVPITIPRYMWDSSDPLLCTEVIFGNGEFFRTGTAAGPGSIKEQRRTGQAQVNPMGPTQFSPFRVIQGAQGSIGIVTWATLKLELLPTQQKVYHLQTDSLQDLLDVQHELLKYRLCDELLLLNNLNLACLVEQEPSEILLLAKELKKWNLIFVLSGRGELALDRISYLQGDIEDILKEKKLLSPENITKIDEDTIIQFLTQPTIQPWKLRLTGGYQDIFFITNFERIPELVAFVKQQYSQYLGIYIQAINQGTSYHCEFDLYYDPNNDNERSNITEKFQMISTDLMKKGAFFNRPYGIWAKEVFERHQSSTQIALRKIKNIFDPNGVLNPGVLCFDDNKTQSHQEGV
ncbi:MAG: FAD-binding oxidoreductase [Candidatus Thorarchaeota archaeon]